MPEIFFFFSSLSWSQNYYLKHKSGYARLVWLSGSVATYEVHYQSGHMMGLRTQSPEKDVQEAAIQYFSQP